MKYAKEVIDLLAAYPGREFRMAQIIRHVSRGMNLTEPRRSAMREGVRQVLVDLMRTGQVQQEKSGPTSAYYSWSCKLQDGVIQNCKRNCNNTARTIAS